MSKLQNVQTNMFCLIRRAFAQGVSDHQKMNCQFKSEVEIEQERITTIEQIKSIA
jgi:hypothetical protein